MELEVSHKLPLVDLPPPAMVTDQDIIARASGGLALCGIHVHESDNDFGRFRARKQLLRAPEHGKLMNSDQSYEVRSHSCSNIQANESFREEVKNSGWSTAMNLHANVCGFDFKTFEGGEGRAKNKQMSLSSQDMTKEACQMQSWYCPIASFAIPLHEMQLSEAALNDARRVQNPSDAEGFLSDYNSHVSTGKYYVGGVLMKGLMMRATTTAGLHKLMEKVSKNANANVPTGVDFGGLSKVGGQVEVGGKVEFTSEESSSSTEQRASHKETVEYVYTALGPRTDEEEDFKSRLGDKTTWDIIDKTNNPDLVPVWEIPSFKNAEDLQICCDLLREAWQNSVKNTAPEKQGRIYSLLQASYMENVKSLLAVSSTSEELKELKRILRKIWLVKTENLDERRTRDLFQLGKFHDLLERIVESPETDFLDDGRALVRSFITEPNLQAWLEGEGIHLRSSVQALLRNEVEPVLPLPPLEDMSLGGLVDRLKTLLGRPSCGSTGAAVTAFDSNAAAKTIRDFLRQSRSDGSSVGVRNLIMRHGFDEDGEIRYLTCVTREEVSILVDKLESTTQTDLPEVEDVGAGPMTPRGCQSPIFDIATLRDENLEDILGRNPKLLRHEILSKGICKVYNRHMLVDRPRDISDPQRRMMDRIIHRLDPFASTLSKPDNVSKWEDFFAHAGPVDKGMSGDDIAKSHPTPISSPLGVLVQLLTNLDLLDQTALFQLLLDARIGIPIVVLWKTRTEENNAFGHLVEALDFVHVKLAKQEILLIAEDTKLPRVVFLSNRKSSSKRETSLMASKVMNFLLPSKFFEGDNGDGITVIELGVGFLKISENESQDHKPCLVFCVWGDHTLLGEFLAKVADVIIVEMDPSGEASPLSWIGDHPKDHILCWKIDPSDQGYKKEPYSTLWGSFQQIAERIGGWLLLRIVKQKLFKGASEGGAATLEQCLTSVPPINKETSDFKPAYLDGIELEKAKQSLQLQKNFSEEAVLYFKSLGQKGEKPRYDSKRRSLQRERRQLASKIQELPLLRTFISVLSLNDYVERNIGILYLELTIERKLHLILKRAYEKEAKAFEESQQNEDNTQLKEKYREARREHVNKKLGLEHLWRELSHIFVANTHLKYLPQLAAEHLIDGFPLEILDGDASMFNSLWVESILGELNMALSVALKHMPKVFVLSIIGLQSSGKSTLLNVMFGTKLKTSAGQCTRGVYLQLVKSERKEFDYVLILDTEGIRSPEFYGQENAEVHDNRLATFAVLPADACIVMVANEDHNGLKEVLPMVMLAFKDSAMAEQCAGRRQAKCFFAYRSVDTNDVSKLGRNQRKLQEDLRSASRDLGNYAPVGLTTGASLGSSRSNHVIDTLLRDFRISIKEEESDVKYFGNLKTGNVPPGDTPDWDYGTKVERLREYIHGRVTDDGFWKAYELKNWATHLKLVWDCIAEANFEISFRNQMEYLQFMLLQHELVASRQKVGKKWMEEFEKLAGALQVERSTTQGLDGSFQPCFNNLRLIVQQTVDESAEKVKANLQQPQWQKWKVDELRNWKKFCSEQERDWQRRLQECIDAVFKFDNVVKDYNVKIQMEIDAKTHNFDMTSPNRQKNMKSEFDEIFQRILRQAQSEHPPMAEKVPSNVTRVYEEAKITGQRFDFTAKEEPSDGNSQKKSSTNRISRVTRNQDSNALDRDEVIAVLESRVEAYLQNTKQYADYLVEQMIRFTENLTEEAKLSKPDQHTIHRHVKQLLTKKLRTIQEKWDKNHNVSKRLEEEEQRLWLFFQNCANRQDGTKMLFTEIDNLLRSKLMDYFRSNLSNYVSDKLLSAAWAGNSIVMRAYLDLHLVELIEASNTETSNTNELLGCVRDGADHYKQVVDTLIKQETLKQVTDDGLWASFLKAIQKAVKAAALRASVSESGSSRSSVFVKNLVRSINEIGAGSLELTRNISNYVSEEVYSKYGAVLDFDRLANDVCQGLDIIKPDLTSSSIQAVVKLVTERMLKCATENVGPRCVETCPHCELTCFRPMHHPGDHDTLHQPSGLCGRYYHGTLELVPLSCSESVIAKHKFKDPAMEINKWTPYTAWDQHYKEWKVPTKSSLGTVHVREYIFAHYQEEIVKYYSTEDNPLKICGAIPPDFLGHEIGALRLELESIIAST